MSSAQHPMTFGSTKMAVKVCALALLQSFRNHLLTWLQQKYILGGARIQKTKQKRGHELSRGSVRRFSPGRPVEDLLLQQVALQQIQLQLLVLDLVLQLRQLPRHLSTEKKEKKKTSGQKAAKVELYVCI